MQGGTPLPRDLTGLFGQLSDHHCFGCAPRNPKGLRLVFSEREGEVVAPLCVGADYESFPGVIHGGIIGAILDEVMGRAVLCAHHRLSLTVALRIRFAQVMETGKAYLARAAVVSGDGSVVKVHGQIESARNSLVAVAEGTFVLLAHDWLRSGQALLPELTLRQVEVMSRGHTPQSDSEVAL